MLAAVEAQEDLDKIPYGGIIAVDIPTQWGRQDASHGTGAEGWGGAAVQGGPGHMESVYRMVKAVRCCHEAIGRGAG